MFGFGRRRAHLAAAANAERLRGLGAELHWRRDAVTTARGHSRFGYVLAVVLPLLGVAFLWLAVSAAIRVNGDPAAGVQGRWGGFVPLWFYVSATVLIGVLLIAFSVVGLVGNHRELTRAEAALAHFRREHRNEMAAIEAVAARVARGERAAAARLRAERRSSRRLKSTDASR